MTGLLIAVEVLVSLLVLSVVLLVAAVLLRRHVLSRDADLVLCALRGPRSTAARTGLLRLTRADLEWHPTFGLTTRPERRWSRRGVDFGPPTPVEAEDRIGLGLVLAVKVDVSARSPRGTEEHAHLVLPAHAYTAVRAWAEAAPPARLPFDG